MKTVYISIIVISLILVGTSNFSTAHIEIPRISTSQSNFTDGDIIPINGYALPNSTTNIFLVNNFGNIQNSTQVISNSTGYFNTSLGIPSHAIGGAWTLFAISGDSNFAMQLMVDFHGTNTPPFHSPGIFPPLKQFKLNIKPSDVQCRSDLRLIIKSEDGSPACVKFSTAESLIRHGWASSESGISSDGQKTYIIQDSSASSIPCDTPYPQSNTGIAVLYMPTNSTGKLCVNYSNPNPSRSVDVRIFEARHLSEDTKDIQILSSQSNIPQGNSTIVYTLKTSKVGFYGLTLFCYGTPLAVGYDNQSRIVANDFPWLGQTFYCPIQSYTFHISGLSGIGVKYIPYQ